MLGGGGGGGLLCAGSSGLLRVGGLSQYFDFVCRVAGACGWRLVWFSVLCQEGSGGPTGHGRVCSHRHICICYPQGGGVGWGGGVCEWASLSPESLKLAQVLEAQVLEAQVHEAHQHNRTGACRQRQ